MMETKALAQWGIIAVSILVGLALTGLGLIAVVHDGDVTRLIVDDLAGVVTWGLPVLGGIMSVAQVVTGYIAVKTNTSGSSTSAGNTTLQVPVTLQAAPQPAPAAAVQVSSGGVGI